MIKSNINDQKEDNPNEETINRKKQKWIHIEHYDVIETKIDEYVKGNNENIHIIHIVHKKGLYQNIVLETVKYLNNLNSNEFMIEKKSNTSKQEKIDGNHSNLKIGLCCCIICGEENQNSDATTMVYIGCKNADEQQQFGAGSDKNRHDVCCMTCAILYFLSEFNNIIINKKPIYQVNDLVLSFQHLLTKITCPICRSTIAEKDACDCEEHKKERSLHKIKEMVLDIQSKLCNIANESRISVKNVREMFIDEFYQQPNRGDDHNHEIANIIHFEHRNINNNNNTNRLINLDTLFFPLR